MPNCSRLRWHACTSKWPAPWTAIPPAPHGGGRGDGREKTTGRAISKDAGFTTGAISPWCNGKEAIYAELLEAWLARLNQQLASALDGNPAGAARRVIQAFFAYYAGRATEFSLGMYLFLGLGPRGLGQAADDRLNAHLRNCVAQLGHGLRMAKRWPDDIVAVEQMKVFTYLKLG